LGTKKTRKFDDKTESKSKRRKRKGPANQHPALITDKMNKKQEREKKRKKAKQPD
jgi:hypothetical protein